MSSTNDKREPQGELVMRTVAMPADTNPNGDIFGGWVMSIMDLGAAEIAKTIARRRVATVAADAMNFLCPIYVGDLITCYAEHEKIGKSSVIIRVEVWSKRHSTGQEVCVTEGKFTFVAIDENGRPVPIKASRPTL